MGRRAARTAFPAAMLWARLPFLALLPMFSAPFYRHGLAMALGLALASAAPTHAQHPSGNQQAKPRRATSPSKTTGVSAAPQPTPSLASSPQVVLDATPANSTPAQTGWFADLGAAQAQAKATNRPMVVVFSGSDWCAPCVRYEREVFAQPSFAAYAKNRLVLAHFDYPRQPKNQPSAAQAKRNQAATAQLNREGDFPLAVIVSPEGKVLAKTGYIAGGPAAFAAYLRQVLPTL